VDIVETALGDTTLDGHLTAFVRHFTLIAGPALSPFITLCRSAALAGSFPATQTFFFMRSALCRPNRV
jgi:hypothetical protein